MEQKQKLLGDQVENTADKLKQLKSAQKQVQRQFEQGDIGADQYRAFKREIKETESKLEHFEGQLKSAQKQANKFGQKLKEAGGKMKSIGGGMKDIGGKLSATFTAPILGAIGLATEGTEEFRTSLSKLENNAKSAGISAEFIESAFVDMSHVTDDTAEKTEALSNLLATGFDKQGLTKSLDALAGAAIKFPDTLKIEGLADGLQETVATGKAVGPFAELLDRLGVNTDKFSKGLQKAKKAGEAQNYVLQTLAKTGLAEANEQYKKNNKALVESKESSAQFKQSMAELGDTLQPLITKVTQFVTGLIDKFNNLSPAGKQIAIIIGLIVAAIPPLIALIGGVIVVLGSLTTAAGALNIAMGPLILIILGIMAAIAALIAIGVLLWKNWDKIKAKAIEIWGYIKTFFSKIWNGIKLVASTVWGGIKSFILGVWDKIKAGAAIFGKIKDGIVGAFESVKSKISSIWSGIWGTIKKFINWIIGGINSMIRGINNLSFSAPDWVPFIGGKSFGFSIPQIPKLDVGTNYVKDDGLAYLHEGEAVVPKKYNPALGNGGDLNLTLEIPLDGETIAKKTVRFTAQELGELQATAARG